MPLVRARTPFFFFLRNACYHRKVIEKSPPRLGIYRFLMYCAKNRVEEGKAKRAPSREKIGPGICEAPDCS